MKFKKSTSQLPVVEVRRCIICGEVFAINSKQMNKIYCCDCKKTAYRVKKRDYLKQYVRAKGECYNMKYYTPKSHEYICAICGKTYTTSHNGVTKYCINCLKNSNDAKLQQRYYLRKIDDDE